MLPRKAQQHARGKLTTMPVAMCTVVSDQGTVQETQFHLIWKAGGCCPNGYVCQTADRCDPPAGFTAGPSVSYNCPASLYLCPSSLGYGCCPSSMGCAVNQCYSTIPTTATTTYTVTTTYDGTPELLITTATVVQTPTPPPTSVIPVEKDGEQPVLKYFPSTVPKFTPSANSSQQEKGNGSSGLSPVQLGGIIGGAAAFLILAMIITYLFIRHLNWLATTFKQSSESRSAQIRHGVHGTPGPGTEDTGMFPPKATPSPSELLYGSRSSVQAASGSQVDAMVYGNTLGVRMDQNRSWGDTSQPGRQEMAVIGSHTLVGQHQRHRSGDEMRANDENWADQSGRRWTNTSELSSNYGSSGPVSPTSIAELDSTPPAAGSPEPCSAHRPPLRRRQRCPDNDISMLTRPSLDHQLRSNDDSARHPEYFVPGQLNAVHEHLHGFYGPPGHTEGETRSEETSPGMS